MFDFDYGPAALAEGMAAFMAICERSFAKAHEHLTSLCADKANRSLKAQSAAQLCLLGDHDAAQVQLAAAKAEHRALYRGHSLEPPDVFPSRLVMGAYRHVLTEAEQVMLRGLFDRREASD